MTARVPGAVLISALLLGAACSTSSQSSTAPTSTGPTVTASATTTASTLPPLIPQTSPDVAARALLDAWRAGDRGAAAHVATAAAISTLFAQPPQSYSDRGCQDPLVGASNCAFGLGGGLLALHTVTLAGGWVVESVTFE